MSDGHSSEQQQRVLPGMVMFKRQLHAVVINLHTESRLQKDQITVAA